MRLIIITAIDFMLVTASVILLLCIAHSDITSSRDIFMEIIITSIIIIRLVSKYVLIRMYHNHNKYE